MAKLTILLVSVFAALLLVDASIYRTTIIIDDEKGDQGKGREPQQECKQQYEEQDNLRHCQDYMRQQIQTQKPGEREGEEEGGRCKGGRCEIDTGTAGKGEEHFQPCCNQLRRVSDQCRCDVLQQAAYEQQQEQGQGRQQREKLQEVLQVARNLPQLCKLAPGQCQFRPLSVF